MPIRFLVCVLTALASLWLRFGFALASLWSAQAAHAQGLPPELQTDDPEEIECLLERAEKLTIIGDGFESQGDFKRAFETFSLALVIPHTLLGGKHPDTFMSYNDVALTYANMGDFGRAEQMLAQALGESQAIFGERDPGTLTSLANYGTVLSMQGRYQEAEELLTKALRLQLQVLGPTHPSTLISLNGVVRLTAPD